jgi:hypothetical protein
MNAWKQASNKQELIYQICQQGKDGTDSSNNIGNERSALYAMFASQSVAVYTILPL